MSKEKELQKKVSLFDATAINIGAIIGVGIYVVTGVVAGLAGSDLVVSMILAAIVALFTALSYMELAAWLPAESGVYEYGNKLISPIAGFLGGWMWLLSNTLAGSAVCLGFAHYFGAFFPAIDYRITPALVCLLFTILYYFGIKESAKINDVLVATKLLILTFFIGFGFMFVKIQNFVPFQPLNAGVLFGAYYIFFAYGGFARVSVVAEEVVDAKRNVPRAIILSLLISTLFYILIGLVAVGLVGPVNLASSKSPLATAITVTGSSVAVMLVSLGGLLSTASVLLTSILGVSRLAYSMARKGDLPPSLNSVNSRFGSPTLAVMITGAVMALIAIFVDLTNVVSMSTFAMLFYYGVGNVSALRLKNRIYPKIVPVIGVVVCLTLLFFIFFLNPEEIIVGLTTILLSTIFYGAHQKIKLKL